MSVKTLPDRKSSPKLVEAALANKQADQMVAAYALTTYLDLRRELMDE